MPADPDRHLVLPKAATGLEKAKGWQSRGVGLRRCILSESDEPHYCLVILSCARRIGLRRPKAIMAQFNAGCGDLLRRDVVVDDFEHGREPFSRPVQ